MKKRIASLALATLVFAGSLSAYAASYPNDIAKSKYKDAIKYTYDNNIVTGYSDGTFRPSDTITRSEFAVMVARWRKLKLDKKSDFTDAKDSWASKEIAAVAKKGWMLGTGDGKFSPEEKISYIEALTVMVRAVGKESEAEEFGGYPLGYSYTSDRYGFTEGIAGGLDSPIYRGAVSQLVYNSKDRFDAVEGGTEDSSTGLVDRLGVVKSYEFLESRNIRVQKDVDLASAIEQLPREVYVLLESGQGVLIKVKWDLNSSYNKDVAGTYSVKGKVELPKGIKDTKKKIPTSLYGTVEVVEGEPDTTGEKIVNTYYEFSVSEHTADFGATLEEAKAKLPSKITLYLIGGGSVEADIDWSIPGYDGLLSKRYEATGKILLPTGVVDRLGVVKDVKATLIVDSEPKDLAIKNVIMVNALEYKITLNKFMSAILDGAVTVEQTGVGAKGDDEFVDTVSFGSSKRELVVKLKKPLVGTGYQFKVYDGEKTSVGFSYLPKSDANTIGKIIVQDNIIPADESTKLNFKALNPDGIDITEAVRDKVKVVNTIEDKLSSQSFNLLHNQVEFFYLEYEDRNGDKKTTPTKRIIGENRRIVSIEDWTFGGDTPDWTKTAKVLYKGGGDKKLYINPKDQFGDVGKVEFLAGDTIKLNEPQVLRTDIASVALRSFNDGEKYSENSLAEIKLANPAKLGTTNLNVEIIRDSGSFKTTIPIVVVESPVLSSLYLEKSTITLSSSASLEDSDKTEMVEVKLRDQYGKDLVPGSDVGFEILSGGNDLITVARDGTAEDEFIIKSIDGKSGTAKVKFTYVLDGKTMTTEMTVIVKSPGPISYMNYIGFKEELVKDTDDTDPDISEKMEIKIYQYDKDGVMVNRVKGNITAEITNKGIVLTGVATESNGIVMVDSAKLTANTVNTLIVKVGGITVLEEKFVVK